MITSQLTNLLIVKLSFHQITTYVSFGFTIQYYAFLISKRSEVYKRKNGRARVATEPKFQ